MNRRLRPGALFWWSVRRAVRAYGFLRAVAMPVGLFLLWLLLSAVLRQGITLKPWHLALVLPAVAAAFAAWRITTDKSSGFAEGLAWSAAADGKTSALCTLGAYAVLCGAQVALLVVLIHIVASR